MWLRGLLESERVDPRSITELTRAQLEFLGDDLSARADSMQRLFPEGRVFTLSLYASAWVNVGRREGEQRARALGECRRALALLEQADSQAPFTTAAGLPHGMFYEAWTNWVRGGCLVLSDNAQAAAQASSDFVGACSRLEDAFRKHGPFVESYPGKAWPADSVVGAASLALCARWLGARYRTGVTDWLAAARSTLDPETGLLPHSVHAPGARGSSAALMCAFLPNIDAAFAREQYARFREHFDGRLLGALPAFREYPRGHEGSGDIDSGPLVFGVSGPATVVGIAAASANSDAPTLLALRRESEAVGLPFAWSGRRRYGFGLLPVGEAFLAWASTADVWTREPIPRMDVASPVVTPLRWVSALVLCTLLGFAWLAWPART